VQLRLSARAEQDLIEIWNVIAKDSETTADRIFDLLVVLHTRRRMSEIL
jgi:plasmid stabilization system protein ParE